MKTTVKVRTSTFDNAHLQILQTTAEGQVALPDVTRGVHATVSFFHRQAHSVNSRQVFPRYHLSSRLSSKIGCTLQSTAAKRGSRHRGKSSVSLHDCLARIEIAAIRQLLELLHDVSFGTVLVPGQAGQTHYDSLWSDPVTESHLAQIPAQRAVRSCKVVNFSKLVRLRRDR